MSDVTGVVGEVFDDPSHSQKFPTPPNWSTPADRGGVKRISDPSPLMSNYDEFSESGNN